MSFASRRFKTFLILLLSALIISTVIGFYFIVFNIKFVADQNDVRVGIVDSGCYRTQTRVAEAVSFANYSYGYKSNVYNPYDVLNHGGKVCNKISVLAPEAALYSAKIAGEGGEITYDGLLAAIEWLVIDQDVDIVNLSLGAFFYLSEEFRETLKEYADKGVIFVTASGNDGGNIDHVGLLQWPSVLPWTIAVGAINEDGEVEEFSSFGPSIYQADVVEYGAFGEIGGVVGTSFAAPKITGIMARSMRLALDLGFELKAYQLQTLLALSTNLNFLNSTGWGDISMDVIEENIESYLPLLNSTQLIEGASVTDTQTRFVGERITKRFKVLSPQPNITISGVENATWKTVMSGDWGALVEVEFTVPDTTLLKLNISATNSVELTLKVRNENFQTLLMDNSLSATGYNFPGGSLRTLDQELRELNIVADYEHFGKRSLENYDIVVLLDAGQIIVSDSGKIFTRTQDPVVYQPYLDYVTGGGNLFIFGNSTDLQGSNLSGFYNSLGVNLTSNIKRFSNSYVTSTNFTTNAKYDKLFDGVDTINYKGMGMKAISENVTELAWYTEIVSGLISQKVNHALAVYGTVGSGQFIAFNSLDVLRNTIIDSSNGSLIFFLNSIQWLFNETLEGNV